jgi:hypothetical protein
VAKQLPHHCHHHRSKRTAQQLISLQVQKIDVSSTAFEQKNFKSAGWENTPDVGNFKVALGIKSQMEALYVAKMPCDLSQITACRPRVTGSREPQSVQQATKHNTADKIRHLGYWQSNLRIFFEHPILVAYSAFSTCCSYSYDWVTTSVLRTVSKCIFKG